MKELNTARMNEHCPYRLEKSVRRHNYFTFTSSVGAEFAVGFDEDDLFSFESYQFIIVKTNEIPSPRDKGVRDTVIAVIQEFFRVNNSTMLYICDTGDGKQAMRSRLFNYWISSVLDKGKFTILQSSIKDEEGIDNYYAIITRNDNPFAKQAINEFWENTYLLSHKPDE